MLYNQHHVSSSELSHLPKQKPPQLNHASPSSFPSRRPSPSSFLSLWICLFWGPHASGIVQCPSVTDFCPLIYSRCVIKIHRCVRIPSSLQSNKLPMCGCGALCMPAPPSTGACAAFSSWRLWALLTVLYCDDTGASGSII